MVRAARATYTRLMIRRPIVEVTGLLMALGLGLASPSGVGSRAVVEHRVDDDGPAYTPDGKTIIFERFFSTQRRGIDTHPVAKRAVLMVMRPDGSQKRTLRHPGATFEHDASFSSDGRSIVFVRGGRIFVMRRDGSQARLVSPDSGNHACPRLSPDGGMISFWQGSATSGAYFVMNADGSAVRRISRGDRFPWGCPAWFPDGKRVVLANHYNLYVAAVDGTAIRRITSDADGTLYRPSVSPDGRWIACDGWHRRIGYGIIVMRANGSGLKRITTAPNEIDNDASPSWSPDGRSIVFSGSRAPFRGFGIYVVKRDGTQLRRLSNPVR